MLILIFLYLLITVTCVASGYLLEGWINLKPEAGTTRKHWIVYACWGFVTITCIGQVIQLFLPLNQLSWVLLSAFLLVIYLVKRNLRMQLSAWFYLLRSTPPAFVLIMSIAVIFIAVFNAGPTLMDDTESYHIQMVKWIQEYGSPPGLANLHERYGFNSSWFTVVAFFIPAGTQLNFFTLVNGTLSVWLLVYLLQNIWASNKPPTGRTNLITYSSFLVLLAALFCWPMLRGNATNANYDFITAVILLVLFIELMKAQRDEEWRQYLPEIIIWPVYLITLRIINYPYLLITVFGLIHLLRYKNYQQVLKYTLLTTALIVPFLTRNVLLSGYLCYPFYQLDLFAVDWKADPVLAKRIMEFIRYFNRVNAGFMPTHETAKLATPDWIPVWFKYLFAYDKPLLIAGITGLIAAPVVRGNWKQRSSPIKWFIVVSLLQLVSWFIIAPDPRFVYGSLLVGIFLLPYILFKQTSPLTNLRYVRAGIIFTVILMLGYASVKVIRNEQYFNPLLPVTLPSPKTMSVKLGEVEARIPEKFLSNWNARCYATDLPCLYEVQPGLKARGKILSEGFRIGK